MYSSPHIRMSSLVTCLLLLLFTVNALETNGTKLRTAYCGDCQEVTISSSGPAAQYQPNSLGKYKFAGDLWEHMVPYWKNDHNQIITPDSNSNPIVYYMKWIVSEHVGGYIGTIMNEDYTDGITCPYDIPDKWQYKQVSEDGAQNWFVDPTLQVTCTEYK